MPIPNRLPPFFLLILAFSTLAMRPVGAQQGASPAPSPAASPVSPGASPAAPPAATAPSWIPADIDVCGGPHELLNKVGLTPCVFVLGEGMATIGYANASLTGSVGIRNYNVSLHGTITSYVLPQVAFGVSPESQISIILPSYAQVVSSRFGTLASGATDMSFEYKQRLGMSTRSNTITAFTLGYDAPTGSPPLRAPGPAYTTSFIVSQPLGAGFAGVVSLQYENAATPAAPGGSSGQRTDSLTPTAIVYWTSPGGTMLAVTAAHNFNPNQWPVVFTGEQLVGRHALLALSYGGLNTSRDVQASVGQIVSIPVTANPRLFTANVYFLFGKSDVPGEEPPPPAPAAPSPTSP